jgi:hypothetical protein
MWFRWEWLWVVLYHFVRRGIGQWCVRDSTVAILLILVVTMLVLACVWSLGLHAGYVGPLFPREDDCNWNDVTSRVSKSAGFWSVGQWFQVDAARNRFFISLMRCRMNCFSGLLLLFQCSTISLWHQSFTFRLGYLELKDVLVLWKFVLKISAYI